MEETERNLIVELENAQTALDASRSHGTEGSVVESSSSETRQDTAALQAQPAILEDLETKKKELVWIPFKFFDKQILLVLPFSY